jgi:hypothetical protein
MDQATLQPGAVIRIAAFDDVPEHDFEVLTVEEDHVTGIALTGPLAGQYPPSIIAVHI